MDSSILYFEKGYHDATDQKDWYQCVVIRQKANCFVIADDSEVMWFPDLPNIERVETYGQLIEKMAEKGWKLCE